MANVVGEFVVTIHKAAKLRDTQTFGRQDPYCRVRLDTQEKQEAQKTRVHEDGSTNPVWEQTFLFSNLQGNERTLIVEILDEETLKDDMIGAAAIPLDELMRNSDGKSHWYPVTYNKKAAGDIQITSAYKGPNQQQQQQQANPYGYAPQYAQQYAPPQYGQQYAPQQYAPPPQYGQYAPPPQQYAPPPQQNLYPAQQYAQQQPQPVQPVQPVQQVQPAQPVQPVQPVQPAQPQQPPQQVWGQAPPVAQPYVAPQPYALPAYQQVQQPYAPYPPQQQQQQQYAQPPVQMPYGYPAPPK